ncbi:MAG: ykvP 2 [Gemmatimonadetes bacterium]|nr:ykvP 2 [Gemmatimonadota bacterium]
MVTALEQAGVHVSSYGPGWPNGPIGADLVATVFAQSRIILGVGTIAHNASVYTLKLRDFDAPMAGALYITHRNPDLARLYTEGVEIECYEDTAELVQKVKYYLAHPAQRIGVAARGRARALRDHTWDKRLAELFAVLRGGAA